MVSNGKRVLGEIRDKRAAKSARTNGLSVRESLHKVELPPGWHIAHSEASLTFRPNASPTPSLKIHLTGPPYMVDIDRREKGRKIVSTRETIVDPANVHGWVQDWLDYLYKNYKEAA